MRWGVVLVIVVGGVGGARIGIDDTYPPYLCATTTTGAAAPISWSSGPHARRLYESATVELRAEGIRLITHAAAIPQRASEWMSTPCAADHRALCVTPEGGGAVLSSWWPPVVSDEPHPNEAMRALASDAACEKAGVGGGRRFSQLFQKLLPLATL
jgi:hypothetical protein